MTQISTELNMVVLRQGEEDAKIVSALSRALSQDTIASERPSFKIEGPVQLAFAGTALDADGKEVQYLKEHAGSKLSFSPERNSSDFDFNIVLDRETLLVSSALENARIEMQIRGNKHEIKILFMSGKLENQISILFTHDSKISYAGNQESEHSTVHAADLQKTEMPRRVHPAFTPNLDISLNVVKRVSPASGENEYLLVMEARHKKSTGGLWYLPGGKANSFEDMLTALGRETLEEGGIKVKPKLLISVDQVFHQVEQVMRTRYIFLSEQEGNDPPKSRPDKESEKAEWFTLQQIRDLSLRSNEVIRYIEMAENGQGMPVDQIRAILV